MVIGFKIFRKKINFILITNFILVIKNEKKYLDDNLKEEFTYENYKKFKEGPLNPYLMKSIYVKQIKKWFRYFSKNQILIIKSEDFFKNPA